jgi:PAS domain S-box-containing protein
MMRFYSRSETMNFAELRVLHQALQRTVTAEIATALQNIEALRKTAQAVAAPANVEAFREIADIVPVLIWMSGKSKGSTWFNQPWLDFTGRTMEQELGYGWTEGVHPEDFDRCVSTYNQAFDKREPFRMDYRLRHNDGSWRVINDIGVPRFSRDGAFGGYIGSCLDVTDQRIAERSLRESEEQFRGIFEHAASGIAIADMEGRLLGVNPSFCRMTGYSEAELSRTTFEMIMHPDDLEENLRLNQRLIAQEMPAFEIKNRYIRKGGEAVWVHKYVSLFHDHEGRPNKVVVVAADISAHRRQEEYIRLLMREVNHRSLNLLSVVQAIANQTDAADIEDFRERFSIRIQALAANQNLLARNAWKGAEVEGLVRSHLAPFEDLIGTRIDITGPTLMITAEAAQAIGMAINELAVNAAKYGALASNAGRITISWNLQGANGAGVTFVMNWTEQAVGSIAAPSRRGFGSAVMCQMVEVSLGGTVNLDFPHSGLTWRLTCPATGCLSNLTAGPLPGT